MLAVLRQRNFSLLVLSGLISLIGDWMLIIGLPIYIYLLTHSVLATGLMLFAEQIPAIIVGSFVGVWIDRWNRRTTLLVIDSLMAVGLLPLLFVTSLDHVWLVYLVTAIEAGLAQFLRPATNAFLPEIVATEQLVQANSLTAFSQQAARLIGPALGGVVIGRWGLNGVIVGDALSFLVPIALLSATILPAQHGNYVGDPPRQRRAGVREWREGLGLIRHSRRLSAVLIILAITSVGEGIFGTLLIVYVHQSLHGGAREIGWLMSAQAIGGITGGIFTGILGKRVTSRWAIGIASILFGGIDLVIFNLPTVFPSLVVIVALFMVVGIPGIAMSVGLQSLIQQSVPAPFLGRVFGTFYTVLSLMMLIGIAIASTLTNTFGAITLLSIQGGGYVFAGFLAFALLIPLRSHAAMTAQASR